MGCEGRLDDVAYVRTSGRSWERGSEPSDFIKCVEIIGWPRNCERLKTDDAPCNVFLVLG